MVRSFDLAALPSMPTLSARCLRTFVALVAAFACAAPLFAGDDEIVSEFRKYFKQYKDSATRVEAVMSLDGADKADAPHPDVVDALLPVLKIEDVDVVRAAVRVLSKLKSDAAKQAVFAALEANKDEPVRSGLLRAITEGKYVGAAESIKLLLTDKSWELRRRAIEALASGGDVLVCDVIAPLCLDPEPGVKTTAFEALSSMKSTLVIKPAIAALNDEVWQVRQASITALKRVRSRDAIEPLLMRMPLEEGRLQPEIGYALNEITGRAYGPRKIPDVHPTLHGALPGGGRDRHLRP